MQQVEHSIIKFAKGSFHQNHHVYQERETGDCHYYRFQPVMVYHR